MTRDIETLHRRALALVELASEWGYIVTIETKPDLPLAMGNSHMHIEVRPARVLDSVTLCMIDDHNQALEDAQMAEADEDDEEWTCSSCGGPMYRQPHWNYGQCDDCGRREDLEREAP